MSITRFTFRLMTVEESVDLLRSDNKMVEGLTDRIRAGRRLMAVTTKEEREAARAYAATHPRIPGAGPWIPNATPATTGSSPSAPRTPITPITPPVKPSATSITPAPPPPAPRNTTRHKEPKVLPQPAFDL